MCIIVVAKTKFPSKEVLEMCEKQNGHGGGIAWRENGLVRWKKGLKAIEMLEFEAKGPPWLIHFRIATVGGIRPELTHPFPINSCASLDLEGTTDSGVVAHNGNWFQWHSKVMEMANDGHDLPKGPWSDTRAIAWMTAMHSIDYLKEVNEKVAILTPEQFTTYGSWGWMYDKQTELSFSYNPFIRSGYYSEYDYDSGEWNRKSYGYGTNQNYGTTSYSSYNPNTEPYKKPNVKVTSYKDYYDFIGKNFSTQTNIYLSLLPEESVNSSEPSDEELEKLSRSSR